MMAMKHVCYTLVCVCCMGLWACKDKPSPSGDPKTDMYAASDTEDANSIITYNNAMIQLDDKRRSYLERVISNVSKVEEGLENPSSKLAFAVLMSPIYIAPIQRPGTSTDTPPSALETDDRDFFTSKGEEVSDKFDAIRESYKRLDEYVKAEDYKDDGGRKGNEIIDELIVLLEEYYTLNADLHRRLAAVSDGAERKILQDHPLKSYIFAAKDDFRAIDEFIKTGEAQGGSYAEHEAVFREKYDALETAHKKHSEMSPEGMKDYAGKEASFARFNEAVNSFLVTARRIMRDAASSGQLSDRQLEALSDEMNSVRNAYNHFVD